MKKLRTLLVAIVCYTGAIGQDIPGYNVSNYAGISGFHLNPASIADSRYKFDMTLFGFGFDAGNNYVSVERPPLFKYEDFEPEIRTNDNNTNKFVYLKTDITGPSFMLSLSPKTSMAFTTRGRWLFNIDNITPELAKLAYNGLEVENLYNLRLKNDQFSLNTLAWGETGIGFAHVVQGKGRHFVKVGGQAKVLFGAFSGYLYARSLNYEWKNQYTLSMYNSEFGYGLSDNFRFNPEDPSNILGFQTKPSLGFDFGVVYEYRTHLEKYRYNMDGKENRERRDLNKYKFRIGASLVDLGRLKFTKSPYSADFKADVKEWDVRQIILSDPGNAMNFDPIEAFSDTLKRRFVFDTSKMEYNIGLPTAFSLQFDYNVWKNFYLNLTTYTSPRFISDESKVHVPSYYTISPRWDGKWIGVYVPLTVTKANPINLGTAIRLGPLVVGTTDIGNYLYRDFVNRIDLYAALKVPIMFGRPRDKDGDLVSNKKDKCNKLPGTWENRGCPDTDQDGIVDKKDDCPTKHGSKDHAGCPDSDGDGIYDNKDKCPEAAGTAANKGCPEETAPEEVVKEAPIDTVEVIEEIVEDIPLEKPIDTVVIKPIEPKPLPTPEPKPEPVVKSEFDVITMKTNTVQVTKQGLEVIDELATALQQKPEWRVRITGHTDDIGTDEANMELSRKRAEKVMEELVKRGISGNRIVIQYFGESRPLVPNTSETERAKNRRVEIEIMK